MRVEIDTHTHTLASGHAYNTLNEMAQAAADKGLKGLAITEHAPEMPGTCHLFYFQNLRIVPRKKYGIELLLGTELNIMNARGEIDLPDSVLERLDIAIASIHMPCFKDERTIDNVTAAYEKVMEHPYVDIIGHPDAVMNYLLPVMFRFLLLFLPDASYLQEISRRPDVQ